MRTTPTALAAARRATPEAVTPDARARPDRIRASEDDWASVVADWATVNGWWSLHVPDSRRVRAGLPDWLLIRPPRVVFAELKVDGGRVRPAQKEVRALLARCPGVEVYTWWLPAAWPQVREVLR